jgi:predicted transcriptional regulator
LNRIPPALSECTNDREVFYRKVIDHLSSRKDNSGSYVATISRKIGKGTDWTNNLLRGMVQAGLVYFQVGIGWRLRKGVS